MPNTYDVGDLVRVSGSFTDSDGTAVDPTTLTVYYKDPSGNVSELVNGTDTDVVKSATGNYYTDISIDEVGRWYYRFKGTGSAQAAGETFFLVRKLNIST